MEVAKEPLLHFYVSRAMIALIFVVVLPLLTVMEFATELQLRIVEGYAMGHLHTIVPESVRGPLFVIVRVFVGAQQHRRIAVAVPMPHMHAIMILLRRFMMNRCVNIMWIAWVYVVGQQKWTVSMFVEGVPHFRNVLVA
jgi:hypothetical protein